MSSCYNLISQNERGYPSLYGYCYSGDTHPCVNQTVFINDNTSTLYTLKKQLQILYSQPYSLEWLRNNGYSSTTLTITSLIFNGDEKINSPWRLTATTWTTYSGIGYNVQIDPNGNIYDAYVNMFNETFHFFHIPIKAKVYGDPAGHFIAFLASYSDTFKITISEGNGYEYELLPNQVARWSVGGNETYATLTGTNDSSTVRIYDNECFCETDIDLINCSRSCVSVSLYDECNNDCDNENGPINKFFNRLNALLGYNSKPGISSLPPDISVLYSSDPDKGPNVYFQSLLRAYECCKSEPGSEILFTAPCINEPVYKILEFCNNCDTNVRISGYTLIDPCIKPCPDGYTLNPDGLTCSKYVTTAVTISLTAYTAYTGSRKESYNNSGTRFYKSQLNGNIPYKLSGNTANLYDKNFTLIYPDVTVTTGSLWRNSGNTTDGRLNNTSVWATINAPQTNPPIGEWIGFSYCVYLPASRTYSIGLAADNRTRFKIDGILIYTSEYLDFNSPKDFTYWRVFEMHLTSGKHVIEMEAINDGAEAGFGAEIYMADIATLSAMTTINELSAVTVFSTAKLRSDVTGNPITIFDVGQNSGYRCPDGYALDNCDPSHPVCTSISHVPASGLTNCLDNWDVRFLTYSAGCDYRELVEFDPIQQPLNFSGNCDNIYPYSECNCFYVAIGYRGSDINDRYAQFNLWLTDDLFYTNNRYSYYLHGRASMNYPTIIPGLNLFDNLPTSIKQITNNCPIAPSCDCLDITVGDNTDDNDGYPTSVGGHPVYKFNKSYTITNKCYTEFNLAYSFIYPSYSGLTVDSSDFDGTIGKNESATLTISYTSPIQQNISGIIGYSASTYDPFLCENALIECPGILTFNFTAKPISLTISNTPYDFGLIGDGCCSSKQFIIQNNGSSPITISNLELTNSIFQITEPSVPFSSQQIIAPNGTMDMTIQFCPTGCTDGTVHTSDILITTVEYGIISGSSLDSGFNIVGTCVNPPISASTNSLMFIKHINEQVSSGLTICNRTNVDQTIDMSNCIQFVSGTTNEIVDPLNYGFEIVVQEESTIQNSITYQRNFTIAANSCLDLEIEYDILQANKTFCSLYIKDDCGNVTEIPFTGYSLPYPIVINSITYHNPTCYGNTDGSITYSFSGGVIPYTYIFSGGGVYLTGTLSNTTITFNNLSASTTGTDYIFYLSGNPCDGSTYIPDLSPFITPTSPEVVLLSPPVTTLIEPVPLDIVDTDYTGITCLQLGAVSVTVTGGTTPYIFTWSNGVTQTGMTTPYTAILDGLNAGTYGVIVKDSNGCQKFTTVNLPNLLPIYIVPQTKSVSCYGGNDGIINLSLFNTVPPVTYYISGQTYNGYDVYPSHIDTYTSTTANNLTAGTYYISYIDGNSCSGYTILNLLQPDLLGFNVTSTDVTCSYLTNGTITFNSITGGTSPYSVYASGETTIYSSSTSQTLTNIDGGYYNTYVIDHNGCITPSTLVYINKPEPLTILYDYTATTCYNSSDGIIALTVSGGTPPYSYIWSPSVGNSNYVIGLSHGNYNVSIFDSHGCSISTGLTLPYTSSYCSDLTILDGTNIIPEINGTYYIQMPHTCLNNISEKIITLCQTSPCNFHILSYSGISRTIDDFYLGIDLTNINIPSSGCTNISLIFNPTSAQTYSKTFSITTEYCTYYFTLSGTGVEHIISADTQYLDFGNVCFGTANTKYLTIQNLTPDTRAISIQTVPSEFSSVNTLILSGNSIATIPYTFTPTYFLTNPVLWQREFTGTTKITNCPTLEIGLSGTGYGGNLYVSGLDFGCINKNCYKDLTATIYNNHCLPVGISGVTIPNYYSNALTVLGFTPTIIPAGGSTTFTVRYSAITSLATFMSVSTDFILAPLLVSGITACMIDTLGNISPISPIITVPGTPMTSTVNVTNITSTNLFVSANITNTTGGTPTNVTVTPSLLPIPAPTPPTTAITNSFTISFNDTVPVNEWFNLNLADNCGNHRTLPFYVSSMPIGYTNVVINNPSCFGSNNGSISLTPTGGTAPYTVIWDNGVTGNSITNLTAGTYNVTIYDLYWNSNNFNFTLTEPDVLGISHTVPFNGYVNILVYSANTGYIDLTVTGGTLPYTYYWSGYTYQGLSFNSTMSNLTGLTAGDYMVMVTDANGCQISDFISLTQPDPLTMTITNCTPPVPPATSCSITGGTANITVSGGQGPYTIVVCPTVPQNPLFDVGGPYYGLTTCQELPLCSGATTGTPCISQICYCCDGSLSPCLSANCPITTCDITINNLPPGIYPPGSFNVIDANSGTTSYMAPTSVPDPSTLGFTLSQSPTTCAGKSNGSITVTIVPTMNQLGQYGMGVPPYTYFLNGVQQGAPTTAITKTFTGLTSGYYTVAVQDSDLNLVSQKIYVTQGGISASISTVSETSQQGNGSIIISAIFGGIPPYTITINSSSGVTVYDSFVFNNLSAGNYLIEITDSIGCKFITKPVVNRILPQEEGYVTKRKNAVISNPTIYEKRLGGFKIINKKR